METSVDNKCKAFTSLEQSKKLAEILPLESADMYYHNRSNIPDNYPLPIEWKHNNPLLSQEIPCWSLAALLDALPEKYTELIKEGGMYRIIIKDSFMTCLFDNPVDACVAIIEKLHELKML